MRKPKGGKITLDEVQLRLHFKKHDVNKDGLLSWDELMAAFKTLGESWLVWTTDRALVSADDNEDGHINEFEIEKLIAFAKRKYG